MFIHTWAIAMGLLAATAPVVIHWLTRPRPKRMPLSTLRFVRTVVEQRRSRARLRDWLVLALRTAAVLLIAAAMSRPLFGRRVVVTPQENAAIARVVLLDASQSLAAVGGDVQLFVRARSVAATELAYQPGLAANLILAAAQSKLLFAGLSTNLGALREELATAAPRPEALNVTSALNAVAEQLATASEGARRELVILSDFQRTNWASADFSVLPKETEIRLESVAPSEPIGNVAILNVGVDGRIEVGRPVRLQVEIGNFSPQVHEVRVELRFGRAVTEGTGPLYSSFQLTGMCQPFSRTTLSNDVVPIEPGWMAGEATLTVTSGTLDALPQDNTRHCVWDVRPQPSIVLVSRQSPKQRPSSSYFLERALLPGDATGKNASDSRRLDPSQMDPETIGRADLVVVDHPGQLTDAGINQLASLLRRGRSVLYVASEAADATNLQRLVDAGGTAATLPVTFAPISSSIKRSDVFLGDVRTNAAPFDLFGDQLPSLLRELRIVPGLTSQAVAGTLREDVLGTLSDGSAFLAATSSETGCLAVLNADLEASNLAASPMFVPMLMELIQRRMLIGRRSQTQLTSGEPATVFVPLEAPVISELRVSGPPGADRELGTLESAAGGAVLRLPAVGPPGIYTVSRSNEVLFAVASARPALESDLRTLPADVFRERLAGGRSVSFHSTLGVDEDASDTLWSWLALGCVLCVVGELLTLWVFRL